MTHNKTCLLPLAVLLVGLSLFSMVDTVQAQSISFTSQDVFAIPNVDGTIRFSVNGSYASATLDNDTWVFNNLTFSGSRVSGTLKFSAKNCDVVIHSFTPSSVVGGNNTRRLGSVRYTVEGTGEQVINLGFDSSRPSHVSEWSVINRDNVFFSDGKDWKLLADDTVIVRGLSGTLTVVRYNFGLTVDDRPFYLRHSVIISTAIAVVITVTLATIIKIKTTSKRSLP